MFGVGDAWTSGVRDSRKTRPTFYLPPRRRIFAKLYFLELLLGLGYLFGRKLIDAFLKEAGVDGAEVVVEASHVGPNVSHGTDVFSKLGVSSNRASKQRCA